MSYTMFQYELHYDARITSSCQPSLNAVRVIIIYKQKLNMFIVMSNTMDGS